jgi:hypothetical protein
MHIELRRKNEMYSTEQLRLAKQNGTLDKAYGDMVNAMIRSRYTVSEELALLRQKDDKPEEYTDYYNFVEECKQAVKAEMEGV